MLGIICRRNRGIWVLFIKEMSGLDLLFLSDIFWFLIFLRKEEVNVY